MAKSKTSRGIAQDRREVAGGQKHEVNYEAKKENTTPSKVKAAIKSAGNQRKAVEKKLKS